MIKAYNVKAIKPFVLNLQEINIRIGYEVYISIFCLNEYRFVFRTKAKYRYISGR